MAKVALPMLRTSERVLFKRCRWAWARRHIDGYQPRTSKPALEFGTLVHDSLAAYYLPGLKRGPHPAETFQQLYIDHEVEFQVRVDDEKWENAQELGVAMMEHYIEEYGKDRKIEIIAPEMPFKFKLLDAGGAPFYYVGRFDALAYDLEKGEYFLFEHKTAGSISLTHLPLDEQAGSYWVFAPAWIKKLIREGLIENKHHDLGLDMILYNFLRKAKPDPRPTNAEGLYLNLNGTISKKQPPKYFDRVPVYRDIEDRRAVLKRIRQEQWEHRMVREGKLPIYKNPQSGYPDRHCDVCPYRDMCELHETGSDWREFGRQTFDRVNAYEEYERDLA